METPIYFKDHTAPGLHELLAPLGVDLRLARRLQAPPPPLVAPCRWGGPLRPALVRGAATEVPRELPEVPRRVLDRVRAATAIPRLELVEKAISPTDGFAK